MASRLAFIHENYPAGGAERVSADIGAHMHGRGWEIFMFVCNLNRDKVTQRDDRIIDFIQLPDVSDIHSEKNARFIIEELNRCMVNIFVIPIIPLRRMKEIREGSCSKIVYSHHNPPFFEAYNDHEYYRRSLSGYRKLKRLKRELLYIPFYRLTGKWKKPFIAKYTQTYLDCDMFTMLRPEYCKEVVKAIGVDSEDNHMEWVNNFIYPHHYEELTKKRQVLNLGRLTYVDKRVDRLIDIWEKVWKKFPEWELLIVGEGPEKENLIDRVKSRSIGNVVFKPYTNTPEQYYASASILALTSTHEGWGMVITEGMQAGVVPVAFDCTGAVRTQIEPNGVNGYLIPPFSKRKFAKRLIKLMRDDALRQQMSANVRQKAEQYTPQASCSKWESLFNKLLEEASK